MQDFQILFDHGEPSELDDPALARYGRLGFPSPPAAERPWTFANFVQTVDGIVSLLGAEASGSDIAQSSEDRWLMDLLRAHADAVLLGMGTLRAETALGRPSTRGPVFRIADPALRQLRQRLGRGAERNILLSASADIDFARYAVFDGETVEALLLTTEPVAAALAPRLRGRPHIRVVTCGQGARVDLPAAMHVLRQQFGIRYLLCEGGPTLYSSMLGAGLVDEKFLTVAPIEVGMRVPGGDSARPQAESAGISVNPGLRPTAFAFGGLARDEAIRWEWLSCRKVGNHQFHRLRRLPTNESSSE